MSIFPPTPDQIILKLEYQQEAPVELDEQDMELIRYMGTLLKPYMEVEDGREAG